VREYKFYVEDPGALDLAGIIERLGAIIAYYRGTGGSTHERTKEVWGALKTLLRLPERKWGEWIPVIVEHYTPDFPGQKPVEYFKVLLHQLLERFAEEVKGYNPSVKNLLAKSIRSALDSASRSPYPQLCFFVKEFYSDRLCEDRFRDTCKEVVEYECK
jgi:hypothetical protein